MMNTEHFQQLLTQAQQGPTRFNVDGVEYVLNAVSVPNAGGGKKTLQHVFENVAELTATPPAKNSDKTTDDTTDSGGSSTSGGGNRLDMFKDKQTEPDTQRAKVPWKS